MTDWDTRSFAPWFSIGARSRTIDPPGLYDIEQALAQKLAARSRPGGTSQTPLSRDALSAEAVLLLRHDGLRSLLGVTARRFPHVVNRVAAAWFSPVDMTALLDSMLFNERAERQGFPADVVAELSQVRMHYEAYVAPTLQKVQARQRWEQAQQDALREEARRLRDERIQLRRQRARQTDSSPLRALARRLLG